MSFSFTPPTKSSLNPNATEFVPHIPTATPTLLLPASPPIQSSNSDDEARHYWSCQLPDDITPDFNDDGIANVSLDALSLDEGAQSLTISSSPNTSLLLKKPRDYEDASFTTLLTVPHSFGAPLSSASSLNVHAKAWEAPSSKTSLVIDHNSNRPRPSTGNVGDLVDSILSESPGLVDSKEVYPLAFLANQFPGFSHENLEKVSFANQHNLNTTVDMLTPLECQVEGGSNKVSSSISSALNPNAPVFHSRAVHGERNTMHVSSRDSLRQSVDPYQQPDKDIRCLFSPMSSMQTQSSVVLDSGMGNSSMQYKGNGFHMEIGSSKRPDSDLLAPYITSVSSFQRKVPSPSSANRTSFWCGNGQAVETGNVHPELGEYIPRHGGMPNAYSQQVHPSYSVVNKSSAKELTFEVPSYRMVMRPANLESRNIQSSTRHEERMIDVHDLHVTDAIHVLSHELNTIRSAAKASERSFPVCICVGSEHHKMGVLSPAKLPSAVRRYLLEEERLNYSELQPGLLRVVIW